MRSVTLADFQYQLNTVSCITQMIAGVGDGAGKTDASGSWAYTSDYENRLKQASKSGGVTVTYAYDALGRRVQRTSSTGGTTKFVYDEADVVRDLDASGATIADYLNGPGIDNKLRQTTGGIVSYFATDHLGTTRALTDASGNLTSTLSYDSFGNVTGGSAPTRYTYTGREIDSDMGLKYYRARLYDPQQGRFISEDPVGLIAGVNLYLYVKGSPLKWTDPFGLKELAAPVGEPPPGWEDHEMEKKYDWWDYFVIDLLTGRYRRRQACKPFIERWTENAQATNYYLPGLIAPTGLSLITGGSAARMVGGPTLLQWAASGFGGMQVGAHSYSAAQTGAAVGLSGLVNFGLVSGAYEVGVGVGSAVSAGTTQCGCDH